jgi:AraC family transcriptional regulator
MAVGATMTCQEMTRGSRGTGSLHLAPGQFFGGARLGRSGRGIEISHRIAAGAPDQVLTHTHHDAHFILVTGGDYVSAAGRPPDAGPVLIYNPPGTTHRDHFERGRGSFFAISLSPGYAALALSGTSVPDAPCHLTAPAQHALAMRVATACAVEVSSLSLDALCLELLGSMDARRRAWPLSPPHWLESAVELLKDRYREELTVAEIAAAVGVHPIHLARTFRRHLRCTPGEFARFRRLEQAASLLVRTAHPLAQVALSSGFADQSHFSRVFARYFGLPPGEYRGLAG